MGTLVLGAGLAGLAAAERLVQEGREVTILEARDRIGRRVWTRWDGDARTPIELGAEWIRGSGPVRELLKQVKAETVPARGKRWRRTSGGWEDLEHLADLNSRSIALLSFPEDQPDRSLTDALARCCTDPRFEESVTLLQAYVEGFRAAGPARLSTRWLSQVEQEQPAEASEHRLPAGVDSAVHALPFTPSRKPFPPGGQGITTVSPSWSDGLVAPRRSDWDEWRSLVWWTQPSVHWRPRWRCRAS